VCLKACKKTGARSESQALARIAQICLPPMHTDRCSVIDFLPSIFSRVSGALVRVNCEFAAVLSPIVSPLIDADMEGYSDAAALLRCIATVDYDLGALLICAFEQHPLNLSAEATFSQNTPVSGAEMTPDCVVARHNHLSGVCFALLSHADVRDDCALGRLFTAFWQLSAAFDSSVLRWFGSVVRDPSPHDVAGDRYRRFWVSER
jgi:hypothetical protein